MLVVSPWNLLFLSFSKNGILYFFFCFFGRKDTYLHFAQNFDMPIIVKTRETIVFLGRTETSNRIWR